MNSILNYYLNFVIFIIMTLALMFYRKKHLKLLKLLKRPEWTISIIIISLWSLYILKYNANDSLDDLPKEKKKFKKATIHALVGFIIAVLAYIDLTIPVFWLIWFVVYYLSSNYDL